MYADLAPRRAVYETVRRMVNVVVTDLIETTRARLKSSGVATIDDVRRWPESLVGFSYDVQEQHLALKRFLRRHLYAHPRVRGVTDEATDVIRRLFKIFMHDSSLLPVQYHEKIPPGEEQPEHRARVIADYIAGMTDRYAYREYARLSNFAR
jgi:dGTPase